MNKSLALLVFLFFFAYSRGSVIDSLLLKRSYTKIQLDSILNANGIPPFIIGTVYDIDVYKVSYQTYSYDSTPVLASGMLAFPKNTTCRIPLSSFAHGTQTLRESVPSRMEGGEAVIGMIMASLGYVSTLPDFVGLGDGPKTLLHPYQHAATEASATIDLLRAAKEASSILNYKLNNQLFLTGYSQGGHVTMAAHRTIQNYLGNEFTVTASCPMSGPYDMSGVMVDVMLSDSVYPVPCYLPYLVLSWNQKYHFYSQPSDFLASPYDTLLPPLYNGYYSLGYLNTIVPSVPKHIFKQDVIDSFSNNLNHPFRLALAENDVYDWTPTAPVKILFCRSDKEVNWHNAVTLYNSLKSNGALNVDTVCVNETLSHYECAQYAVLKMKDFFAQFATIDSCSSTAIKNVKQEVFTLFPNPSHESLTLAFEEVNALDKLVAVDAFGKQFIIPFIRTSIAVDANTSSLSEGIYFIKGYVRGEEMYFGRIVKLN